MRPPTKNQWPPTSTKQIDVGSYWEAGLIWGFNGNSGSPADGTNAKPQANLAEIIIGSGQWPGLLRHQQCGMSPLSTPLLMPCKCHRPWINLQQQGDSVFLFLWLEMSTVECLQLANEDRGHANRWRRGANGNTLHTDHLQYPLQWSPCLLPVAQQGHQGMDVITRMGQAMSPPLARAPSRPGAPTPTPIPRTTPVRYLLAKQAVITKWFSALN